MVTIEHTQQITSSYKLIVTQPVECIIRELCAMCPSTEWSGVLFYKVNGTFEDNNLEVICQDILLMDEGSEGHTQFIENPEIIKYQFENDLMDCFQALIHSHNNMAAFFSGEDMNTLNKEGMDRNHFVSLIVNNRGQYVARITRKVNTVKNAHVITNTTTSYSTFNDETKIISNNIIKEYDAKEEKTTKLEWFNLSIIKPEVTVNVNKYIQRLCDIRRNPRQGGSYNYGQFYTIPSSTTPSYQTSPYWETKDKVASLFPKAPEVHKIPEPSAFTQKELDYDELVVLKCSEEVVNDILKQLLTGCIIPNEEINIKQLDCNAVDKYFSSYFGNSDYGRKLFRDYAAMFVDFIICNTYDEDLYMLYNIDDADMQEILARNVISRLESFKCKNFYINTYITELTDQFIDVEEDNKYLKTETDGNEQF